MQRQTAIVKYTHRPTKLVSAYEITMDWSNPNKKEEMSLFKQQCEMLFRR